MTLLPTDAADGVPGTHALVIGVGAYKHMPGGEHPNDHLEIYGEQLTSPPISARRFTDWLLREYEAPHAPLASVDLLISSDTHQDRFYGTQKIEPALYENVDKAFERWSVALDTDERHVGILYFSGHGVRRGTVHALLLEDYGESTRRAFKHAFDVNQTWEDMIAYAARTHYWFIDACDNKPVAARKYVGDLAESLAGGQAGSGTISGGLFTAAAPGMTAYAPPGKASYFTAALLEGLRGTGSVQDRYGENWVIRPSSLGTAIEETLDYLVVTKQLLERQITHAATTPVEAPFHIVGQEPPRVPVLVACDPDDADAQAQLSLTHERDRHVRPKSERLWTVNLPHATYDVEASFAADAVYMKATDRVDVRLPRITRFVRVGKRS